MRCGFRRSTSLPWSISGTTISDYTKIHPVFGALEDFDRLLAALHRRSIKLILDFVPNHTSEQHPWFLESRSSRTNQKRDWYIWQDPGPDGGLPNNWLSAYCCKDHRQACSGMGQDTRVTKIVMHVQICTLRYDTWKNLTFSFSYQTC